MGKYTIQVTEKLEQRYKELRNMDSALYPRWGYGLTDAEFKKQENLLCESKYYFKKKQLWLPLNKQKLGGLSWNSN